MRILLLLLFLCFVREAIAQKKDLSKHLMVGLISNKYFTTEIKARAIIVPRGSYKFSANPGDTNFSKKNSLGYFYEQGIENNYSKDNFRFAIKLGLKAFFVNRYPLINFGPEFLWYTNMVGDRNVRFIIRSRVGLTLFGLLDLDYQYNIFNYGKIPASNFSRHTVNLCFSVNALKTIITDP